MNVLIADGDVQTFFSQIREKVEIHTAQGQVLGYFEPQSKTEELSEQAKEKDGVQP